MQYAITQRYRRCYNTPVNVQCVDNLSLILGWSVYTLWMPIKYVTIFYNFSPWMLVVCTVVESAKLMKPAQKHRESKQYSPSLFPGPYFPFLIFRSLFSVPRFSFAFTVSRFRFRFRSPFHTLWTCIHCWEFKALKN